ncbi:MAG TPA: Mur ligase domain-containing protein [Candidatus Saccharimonadales bacterium]|nr:Mur ligase domain-containing protein [Candidatus Saccharimonadales bacterium]
MNIYFSGIGGVGIGPLAEIAHDAGYSVQGSDAAESLVTRELRQRGIAIMIGQDGRFLHNSHGQTPIDWFVYTAALPADHPELVLAKQLGIKTAKRDELLAHIIAEKNLQLIAVAGTHGKTTTTGMMVWTMQQLGIPVSYSVGSTLSFGPSGKFDPASQYFVYECDEFDRNFLHFQPHLSLITSIDYDHPDTYPTAGEYMAAFRQFVDQSDMAIMWQPDGAQITATADDGWILAPDEVVDLQLPGAHNRRNATLVAKAIEYLKTAPARVTPGGATGPADIAHILEQFPGTDRRFEKLADNLYSDYGHHPVEIAAMLQLARELSDEVVLIYQPHQNVRQHEVRAQYTNQFELAETVYWLPTHLSREDPNLRILTPDELIDNITNHDQIHLAELDDQLWQYIQNARNDGKLVLCMGAGSIDGWLREKISI